MIKESDILRDLQRMHRSDALIFLRHEILAATFNTQLFINDKHPYDSLIYSKIPHI